MAQLFQTQLCRSVQTDASTRQDRLSKALQGRLCSTHHRKTVLSCGVKQPLLNFHCMHSGLSKPASAVCALRTFRLLSSGQFSGSRRACLFCELHTRSFYLPPPSPSSSCFFPCHICTFVLPHFPTRPFQQWMVCTQAACCTCRNRVRTELTRPPPSTNLFVASQAPTASLLASSNTSIPTAPTNSSFQDSHPVTVAYLISLPVDPQQWRPPSHKTIPATSQPG